MGSTLALATSERVAVALPKQSIADGYYSACRALERSCCLDDPRKHNPRLLRWDLLLQLSGFGVGMSGPEDLDLRLGILSEDHNVV